MENTNQTNRKVEGATQETETAKKTVSVELTISEIGMLLSYLPQAWDRDCNKSMDTLKNKLHSVEEAN